MKIKNKYSYSEIIKIDRDLDVFVNDLSGINFGTIELRDNTTGSRVILVDDELESLIKVFNKILKIRKLVKNENNR
ncbi:hypothetical protein KW795_02990, partial [Candidatus Microgenomates bacterium]|nr:hypothetical protein [Candidatus Microgenomates bacterium]